MFDGIMGDRSKSIAVRKRFGALLAFVLGGLTFWPGFIYATVQNVESYGAKGDNGVTDDTGPINMAISHLLPGDTLLFPCTTGNIYVIKSQLTINVTNVTVDGSGCATIKDTYSNTGLPAGRIMVIGGNGASLYATYGAGVTLSATANELSTSFTTTSSLGVNPGDYVYLCHAGADGSSATQGAPCPPSLPPPNPPVCDPAGCRGEVLKVASVSANTLTVTTALHDTYDSASTFAQKIQNPLTGIAVKNISFDGNGTNAYGLVLAGVAYSTVHGVTAKNVQGAAIFGGGDFNLALDSITVTMAGSEDCGAAAHFEQQGNLSLSAVSISSENQQPAQGSGTCFVNAGAFGFELATSANSTVTNLSVDATGAYGRPFKTTAARWNTFNSVTVQNGSTVNYNGIAMEYYSSHNSFNDCIVTKNGSSSGAGIYLFGNYNQYDVFTGCTVTGNAGSQFIDGYFDRLGLGTDSNNAIVGGTFVGPTGGGLSIINLEAPYDSVSGASVSGPAGSGYSGIEMDGPNGPAPGAANACINNNVFTSGSPALTWAISSYVSTGSDTGSGNQLGSLTNNPNAYFTAGTCTAP